MINALIYPAILLVMVGLSLLFLLGYVVPQFAQMYESLDAELPLFTQLVLGNRALAADVDAATEEVRNGAGLAFALGRGKRFPRLALQMIQVGEESGALDTMLLKTADTFEQETSLALDRMLAALVPVVTLVMAVVVGVVIMAVLTPIYDLTSVIG